MSVTNLPIALLSKCLSFIGAGDYIYIAGTCHSFRDAYISYLQQTGKSTTTNYLDALVESVSRIKMELLELDIDIHTPGEKELIQLHGKQVFVFWNAVIGRAAYKGNLDVLVWTIGNKNSYPGKKMWRYDLAPCLEAARGNQLKVLQWLRSDAGQNCCWGKRTSTAAACEGHFELFKWAIQNGCPCDDEACEFAANNGHLQLLKWAHHNGCPWNIRTCTLAAVGNGQIEVLKWLHENGCPWNVEIFNYAVEASQYETLKWLHHNECQWDESTCSLLAEHGGNLEILKWAHHNGCPWDKSTCRLLAEGGNLEMLKWVRHRGCPWDAKTRINAKLFGHLDIFEWARTNGCPYDVEETYY